MKKDLYYLSNGTQNSTKFSRKLGEYDNMIGEKIKSSLLFFKYRPRKLKKGCSQDTFHIIICQTKIDSKRNECGSDKARNRGSTCDCSSLCYLVTMSKVGTLNHRYSLSTSACPMIVCDLVWQPT